MLYEHLLQPNLVFDKPDDGDTDSGSQGKETGDDLDSIDDYKAALKDARSDAAKHRTKRKEIENRVSELEKLEEKFNKFKSVFGEEEDIDPEKLKGERDNLQSQLQKERVKNAVTIQAISEGLDPDLTIAYLDTKGKLSDLDPTDSESIGTLISKTAKEKAALKVNGADKVGAGDDDEATEQKEKLNPIDEYRRKRGLLPKTQK